MIADLRGYTRYTVEHGDEAAAAARNGVRGDRPPRRRGARRTSHRAARRRGARRLRLGAAGAALGARAPGAGGRAPARDRGRARRRRGDSGRRGLPGRSAQSRRATLLAGGAWRCAGDGDRAPARARGRRRQVRRAPRRAREGLRAAGDGDRDPAGGPARQAVDGSAAEARRARARPGGGECGSLAATALAGGIAAARRPRIRGQRRRRPDQAEVARARQPVRTRSRRSCRSVAPARYISARLPLVRELGRQVRRAHRPAHASDRPPVRADPERVRPAWRSGSAASGSSTARSLSSSGSIRSYLTLQRVPLARSGSSQIDHTASTEVAVGAGSVWVAMANHVFRVDPKSLKVVATIDVSQRRPARLRRRQPLGRAQQRSRASARSTRDQRRRADDEAAGLGRLDCRRRRLRSGRASSPTTRSGSSTRGTAPSSAPTTWPTSLETWPGSTAASGSPRRVGSSGSTGRRTRRPATRSPSIRLRSRWAKGCSTSRPT